MPESVSTNPAADKAWAKVAKRSTGGLLEAIGPKNADTAILTLGSVFGTLVEARDAFPRKNPPKLIKLRCFRPFPADALRAACKGVRTLIVLERALSPGGGGIVGDEVRAAFSGVPKAPKVHSFAAGLGGRDVPLEIYPQLLKAVRGAKPEGFAIIDADPANLAKEDR